MATALDEMRGGSTHVSLTSANYNCRLDTGEGGCRLYVVETLTPGCTFTLPDPDFVRPGAQPNFTVINKGPEILAIRNNAGVVINSLFPNNAYEIRIITQGTDTWWLQAFTVSSGTPLNPNRIPYELEYTASTNQTFVFQQHLANRYGYTRSEGPVALIATIRGGVVIGAANAQNPAIWTGFYPSGSTLLLIVEPGACITGAGGDGGNGAYGFVGVGGDANPGGPGGPAVYVSVNTNIVNAGTIQGGGGGGGGGCRVPSTQSVGGTGGGGAGWADGPAFSNPSGAAGAEGQSGTFTNGGGYGGNAGGGIGGRGGAPGVAGNPGTTAPGSVGTPGAGGAAGASFVRVSAYTLNIIQAGSIFGPTVVV